MGSLSKNQNALARELAILAIRKDLFLGRAAKAQLAIDAALHRWPADIAVWQLALSYYHAVQDWDRVFEVYAGMEPWHPDILQFKRNYGTALLSAYRYEEAATQLESCWAQWDSSPEYDGAFMNMLGRLGICYAYLGRWDSYTSTVAEAEKFSPWDPDIIYGRLLFYAGAGDLEGMQAYLNRKIELSPGFYALYYWMALYKHCYLHDPEEAIRWYRLALDRLNSFHHFLKNRQYWKYFYAPIQYANPSYVIQRAIEAYGQLGESERARELLGGARLTIWHKAVDVRDLRVSLDLAFGSYDKAERRCLKLLKRMPHPDPASFFWNLLSQAQSEQGKLDEAAESVGNALRLDSELYEAWAQYGSVSLKRREWPLAKRIYEKMIGMDRFDFCAWEGLGAAHIGDGNWEAAKDAYEQAVKLNPFQGSASIHLGHVYDELHQPALAISAYEKGLRYESADAAERGRAVRALERLRAT